MLGAPLHRVIRLHTSSIENSHVLFLTRAEPREGLDDEAIEFAILSDQVNAIRAVFSGRHLQVFTSGADFMVTGDPLTTANMKLKRQTRTGSPTGHYIPPRDVDGATLFVARNGRKLREFYSPTWSRLIRPTTSPCSRATSSPAPSTRITTPPAPKPSTPSRRSSSSKTKPQCSGPTAPLGARMCGR